LVPTVLTKSDRPVGRSSRTSVPLLWRGGDICVKALGTETQRVEALLGAAWGAARRLL
jgi:hypothetical protein